MIKLLDETVSKVGTPGAMQAPLSPGLGKVCMGAPGAGLWTIPPMGALQDRGMKSTQIRVNVSGVDLAVTQG